MESKTTELIGRLSIDEKARLCAGADHWYTVGVPEKGLPAIMMADGPHGLRKQSGAADHVGVNHSEPATCFPASSAMANSWDTELMGEVGVALGDECQDQGVSLLLGPGVNIKRSPLCGRNFEYFSEDPYLSSHIAAAHIEGVQSKGVGCAIKHFAANNQEENRMSVDTRIDERALREIYLASFEYTIKTSKPWMVMSAYNRLNGDFCSENPRLLTEILRDEWGYEGAVVSDWGAVDDRLAALESGLDLEMPYRNPENAKRIVSAVESGKLQESVLNLSAERIASMALTGDKNRKNGYKTDYSAHSLLAQRAAAESMVLLKNRGKALPLRRSGNLAVIGEFANKMRYQGAGSSRVNPIKVSNIFEELANAAGPSVGITYSQGYCLDNDDIDANMVEDALKAAQDCESIIVIAGIPDRVESEGYDRSDMRLPQNQNHLIEKLAALGKKMAVVLVGGAPVELPWLDRVDCLLAAYLGGQAVAGALAQVLYGDVCPCGKLAETWPEALEHNPSYLNFPGGRNAVHYNEGIFVGYRYYEAKKITPMFPFGYGLSYTGFEYSNIRLDKEAVSDDDTLTVSLDVTNTGECFGKEIVQLYIAAPKTKVLRPVKELKGFVKVSLAPKETKTVLIKLCSRDFTWYNEESGNWQLDGGEYRILAGASSADIRLEASVRVEPKNPPKTVFTQWSSIGEIVATPAGAEVLGQMFASSAKESSQSIDALGVSTFDLIKGMPLKKILAMGNTPDLDAAVENILKAVNGSV